MATIEMATFRKTSREFKLVFIFVIFIQKSNLGLKIKILNFSEFRLRMILASDPTTITCKLSSALKN